MTRINRCINCLKEIKDLELFKVEYTDYNIRVVSHWNCENPTWSPIKENINSLKEWRSQWQGD